MSNSPAHARYERTSEVAEQITGDDFDPVEVVNFQNPWPGARDATVLVREALRDATLPLSPGSPLHVVSLPYLTALKLYASPRGSRVSKSVLDVVELLEHNREDVNIAEVRDVCARHGLGPALELILEELGFQ